MAIASVVQGLIETESGKVFELDSPKGSTWVESVSSFRYVPTGASKPYTVRKEPKKGGDYWYGYRKTGGKLHKRYIGKGSELSTAKLEEIAEALNTPQQSKATEVTQGDNQPVTGVTQVSNPRVTDSRTANRLTALESQMQVVQESLEALRSELLGKSQAGNSSELPKHNAEVTDSELLNLVGNSSPDKSFTAPGGEDIEFLREQNEDLKRLLAQKNPLVSGNLWQEIDKQKERNRQLRLKMGEERRLSIERISELEHQVENMMRRNQEKQARLDELEIQIEGVTDSELQNELSNLEYNHALTTPKEALANVAIFGFSPKEALADAHFQINMLQANYDELEDRHEATKREIAELRSQLEEERAYKKDVEDECWDKEESLNQTRAELVDREKELAVALAEVLDLKQKSAPGVELPEAADLLNQLKTKRKKSKADLADLETILEILEN